MKKKLSLLVRLILALAGIAYIAYNTDWVDRVEVKPGAVLPTGRTVHTLTRMRVIAGKVDPVHQIDALTLADPDNANQPVIIPAATLASDDGRYLLHPSIITTLRHADYRLLAIGFILVGAIYPIQTYRWLILMRCRGLDVTYTKAFRLTMIGCFFNYCMPGSTGGDFVKGYYAARRSDRVWDSAMSVLFDRIAGLLGLIALGGIASCFMLNVPLTRRIAIYLWGGSAVLAVISAVYFSQRLRKRLGINWILARLPGREFIAHVDDAAVAYGHHKAAILTATVISIPVHLALTGATALSGYGVGMKISPGVLLTVVPVIFLSGTLPITPQGAGVWEALGAAMLLHPPDVTFTQIAAMLLLVRFYQLIYSLLGSAYLMRGDVHLHPAVEKVESQGVTNI